MCVNISYILNYQFVEKYGKQLDDARLQANEIVIVPALVNPPTATVATHQPRASSHRLAAPKQPQHRRLSECYNGSVLACTPANFSVNIARGLAISQPLPLTIGSVNQLPQMPTAVSWITIRPPTTLIKTTPSAPTATSGKTFVLDSKVESSLSAAQFLPSIGSPNGNSPSTVSPVRNADSAFLSISTPLQRLAPSPGRSPVVPVRQSQSQPPLMLDGDIGLKPAQSLVIDKVVFMKMY